MSHRRSFVTRRIIAAILAGVLLCFAPAIHAQNVFFGAIRPQPGPSALFTCDPNGNGLTNIYPPAPGGPISVDVDPAIQTVFWTEISFPNPTYRLRSATFTGGSPVVVTTSSPYCVAVDTVNQHLYWGSGGTINRSNYNGSGQTAVLTGLGTVETVEVDPVAGRIFWTDRATTGWNVGAANLNGTSPVTLATRPTSSYLSGITVNPVTQIVYFSDLTLNTIDTVSYSGGATSTLLSGLLAPAGLDLNLALNRLYIVQKNALSVAWTTPAGGPLTTISTPGGYEMYDVATVVPEPAGVGLFLVGVAWVVSRRSSHHLQVH